MPDSWPETTGPELLEAAAKTLADTVIPVLSDDARVAALAVAAALRMATREWRSEREGLVPAPRDAEAIVRALRAGLRDADRALHASLHDAAIRRAALSRPDAVSAEERDRVLTCRTKA